MSKVIIDFEVIESYDPRVIRILDSSIWQHIENKPSAIDITIPGSKIPVKHYFTKNQFNTFNSINLNIDCTTSDCGCEGTEYSFLPDGVYIITVKGSPSKFFKTKSYLKTSSTRLEIDKLYLKSQLPCEGNKNKTDHIEKMYSLIDMAESLVRLDDTCTAQEILFKVQRMLEKCN